LKLILTENNVDDILIKPLDLFLCKNLTDTTFLENLTNLDDESQCCGKIFVKLFLNLQKFNYFFEHF
jgi:hypothetical protein